MKIFIIRRFVPEVKEAKYGIFLDEFKRPFANTLEHPFKLIPTGEYMCKPYSSPKYPNTWEIIVEGRTKILFHWGNFFTDSEGCILVGEKFQDLNSDGVMDIADSRNVPNQGFNEFMEKTKGLTEFKLIIEESYQWIV